MGIECLAAFRMNDEHAGPGLQAGFFNSHPEWRIAGSLALNYSFQGVRDHRLAIFTEVARNYDVDGIELDWMRWMKIFPAAEARARAPLLTDYVQQIRWMLDAAGTGRGRSRLLLGTRVAPNVEATVAMGIDLPEWIRRRLVDYVVPSEFIYNDFRTPVGEYAALVRESACG